MITTRDGSDLGRFGADLVTTTSSITGKWCAIYMVENTTFSTLTCADLDVTGSLLAATFAAGELIRGWFTRITMSSGVVWAYKASIDG